MDIEKIIGLSELGFSKEEILRFIDGSVAAKENKSEEERVATEPAPETSLENEIASLRASVSELTKTNQKLAIQNSSMPEEKELDILDIMNSLVR